MVEVANVVGSGDLGVELDIPEMEADLPVPFAEYDPENYHGLYVRLIEDGPLITLYRSGKYIISGCSSIEELHETDSEFLRTLAGLDIINRSLDTGFTIQNVVCTGDLQESADLNVLSIVLGLEKVEYEPEQFPGLIYRPTEYPGVLLVFTNGKVVVTGITDVETAESTFQQFQKQATVLDDT